MGLFSKIFGDNKEIASALENAARTIAEGAEKAASEVKATVDEAIREADKRTEAAPAQGAPAQESYAQGSASPSGDSWGPQMPAEENQYNYPGTYIEYFDNIFRTEFPGYTITCTRPEQYDAVIFTFLKDGQKALVVELLSRSSAAAKLRRDCQREGIPYLRYYYDYEGWWNTRSYVTRRTAQALEG